MHRIGIITDSTVQFPRQTTIPRNLALVPLDARLQGMAPSEDINSDTRRVVNLPSYATDTVFPQVSPPTVERITTVMAHQAEYCDSILGIFLSSKINGCYDNAVQAANNLRGRVEIEVIDSLTFGVGLGYLVEAALTAVTSGARFDQVEQSVRGLVPNVYGVICTPAPSYLFYNNFIDRGQAVICEMLGLYPIFALEEGVFTPMEKVKNTRHIINYFQEFVDEFEDLQHIAMMQSQPPCTAEHHLLRDHIKETYPKTPFSVHPINLPLATLVGPRSLGLFLMDQE